MDLLLVAVYLVDVYVNLLFIVGDLGRRCALGILDLAAKSSYFVLIILDLDFVLVNLDFVVVDLGDIYIDLLSSTSKLIGAILYSPLAIP